ncbi:hypothetical protein CC85DRAFT_195576 [Cutaneotrichosporon oleaginosum]|uniref:Uncharacterized protein n=1 Tax=Cutaneotrichosporon oleaginosum TaxID=879819 RepID=A0A0J1AW14_9TREE|nr:uncharacterized protein CC85DRAFT_195576 [Cutaneotrichosporon oleaginosum]KLT39464.1 hypothetical protein CC85DRAFT_195576 [Cutaneotrichosporon oleaginosum]TXT09971.1 hypothetical protein COLE_03905 [Cutaneotrichosporon oleaginosum]
MWNKPAQAIQGAVQDWGQWASSSPLGNQQGQQSWQNNGQQQSWQQNNGQQQSWQQHNGQQQSWQDKGQHGQHNQHNQHSQHNQHNQHQGQSSWQPQHQQHNSWQQNQNQAQGHGHGQHNQHKPQHHKPQHHKPNNSVNLNPTWEEMMSASGWAEGHEPGHGHGHGQGHKHSHSHSHSQSQTWSHEVPLQDGSMPRFPGRSDKLVDAPTGHSVRKHYMQHLQPAPLLSRSPFIPRAMVEHLMRKKKDAAISIKYMPGDAISNMEGTAHTFLTPIVFARMHGDYAYEGSHTVLPYAGRAREVVVSAAIQPDFEDCNGMMALARLEHHAIQGVDWPQWGQNIASASEKANPSTRASYDRDVRAHLIHHLVKRLPALHEVHPLSVPQAIAQLEAGATHGAVRLPKAVVSLDLLFRVYVEALANELGALEAVCPSYVYTSDPPAIFARECDATLLNRLQAAALAHLVALNPGRLKNMRIFAFNDYADPQAVWHFQKALQGTGVKVMRKADLFPSTNGGYYSPPAEGKGALLVLHNNSDAFGQNIETEGPGGSMDGAIGCNSSVAGSVRRDRHDLVSRVLKRGERLRVW